MPNYPGRVCQFHLPGVDRLHAQTYFSCGASRALFPRFGGVLLCQFFLVNTTIILRPVKLSSKRMASPSATSASLGVAGDRHSNPTAGGANKKSNADASANTNIGSESNNTDGGWSTHSNISPRCEVLNHLPCLHYFNLGQLSGQSTKKFSCTRDPTVTFGCPMGNTLHGRHRKFDSAWLNSLRDPLVQTSSVCLAGSSPASSGFWIRRGPRERVFRGGILPSTRVQLRPWRPPGRAG